MARLAPPRNRLPRLRLWARRCFGEVLRRKGCSTLLALGAAPGRLHPANKSPALGFRNGTGRCGHLRNHPRAMRRPARPGAAPGLGAGAGLHLLRPGRHAALSFDRHRTNGCKRPLQDHFPPGRVPVHLQGVGYAATAGTAAVSAGDSQDLATLCRYWRRKEVLGSGGPSAAWEGRIWR